MSRRIEDNMRDRQYEDEYERTLYSRDSRASADEEPMRSEVSKIGRVCNAQYARVWKIPSSSSSVMVVLDEGDEVKILKKIDGYYKVELDDGRVGYISSNYLKEV